MLSFKVNFDTNKSIGVTETVAWFNREVYAFADAAGKLNDALQLINTDSSSIIKAKEALKDCRLKYKKIEFFTEYFFPSESRIYNAAPKYEVEEPTLELVEPMGLQQIETLLFDDDVMANKSALLAQAEILASSAGDLKSLLYQFKASDEQVLESLRIQLIRMITLSVSGYDAPLLKSGIAETYESSKTIQEILKPYFDQDPASAKELALVLKNSISYLKKNQDFDAFNRMEYFTKHALPLQKQLGLFIKRKNLEINTSKFLNYNADHLFSRDALKSWGKAPGENKELRLLGEKLFFDKALSGNLAISCASCHQPQNYFADQMVKSPSVFPDSTLKRNTPTLLYAGWQHTQFWDGRAKSMEDQIVNVLFNPLEMDAKKEIIYQNILNNTKYQQLLQASFPAKKNQDMGIREISLAIAAFLNQLSPMNSRFDSYINGEQSAISKEQIEGFNLFMGKAQCGTCHFPPYFNSLLPPLYQLSEVEVIGTPQTDDFDYPNLDNDNGRFDLYAMKYYKGAFKTPTIRNAEKTAPYMHNGSFKTLEKVMDFYNKGGGNGLGLAIEDQSLSAKPLNLSASETKAIIQFIHALTDSINTKNSNYLN